MRESFLALVQSHFLIPLFCFPNEFLDFIIDIKWWKISVSHSLWRKAKSTLLCAKRVLHRVSQHWEEIRRFAASEVPTAQEISPLHWNSADSQRGTFPKQKMQIERWCVQQKRIAKLFVGMMMMMAMMTAAMTVLVRLFTILFFLLSIVSVTHQGIQFLLVQIRVTLPFRVSLQSALQIISSSQSNARACDFPNRARLDILIICEITFLGMKLC